MIEIFNLEFMRNAFMAGIMLGPVLAVVSFFVVLRRLSFVGVGVAHSAFGGIALGFLLGISPTVNWLPEHKTMDMLKKVEANPDRAISEFMPHYLCCLVDWAINNASLSLLVFPNNSFFFLFITSPS